MNDDELRERILGMLRQDKEQAYLAWRESAINRKLVQARIAFDLEIKDGYKSTNNASELSHGEQIRSAEWAMEHKLRKLQEASLILEWAERKLQ